MTPTPTPRPQSPELSTLRAIAALEHYLTREFDLPPEEEPPPTPLLLPHVFDEGRPVTPLALDLDTLVLEDPQKKPLDLIKVVRPMTPPQHHSKKRPLPFFLPEMPNKRSRSAPARCGFGQEAEESLRRVASRIPVLKGRFGAVRG